MNKILTILLIAFLCLTIWIVYECIECFFGGRIRAYFKETRDRRAAFELYYKQQEERKEKIGKALEVQDVEVEDMGLASAVFYDKTGDKVTFTTELIIINE